MKITALLLVTLVACAPPPAPQAIQETSQPELFAGTLSVFRRILYTPIWDGVLNGSYGAVQQPSNGEPPAVSLVCPRMWLSVQRKLKLTTGEWVWEPAQYEFLMDPTAHAIDSQPMGGTTGCSGLGGNCGPTAINTTYCDYQVCKPGTSVAAHTCQPLPLKVGYTTVWMTPACPGDPNRPVGGITEFNGKEVFIGRDSNHLNNPIDQSLTMPQWSGPFGQKGMWGNFARQCGLGVGPDWSASSTPLWGGWCFPGEACPPGGAHRIDASWSL